MVPHNILTVLVSTCVVCVRTPLDYCKEPHLPHSMAPAGTTHMDTLGFEPRAFRMRSGCDATTPCTHNDVCTGYCYILFGQEVSHSVGYHVFVVQKFLNASVAQ